MDVWVGLTDCAPDVVLVPDQAPEAAQVVALVDDQVKVEEPPLVIEVGEAIKLAVGVALAVTVTVALCVAEPPEPEQVKV